MGGLKTTERIITYSMSENALDKSRLKRSCLKIMQRSMDLRIVSTLLMTAGLAQTLTALIGNA